MAWGLARCGFGDRLLAAYGRGLEHLAAFLPQWRADLAAEIQTNASKLLPGTRKINIPATFPNLYVLGLYANPITSARNAVNGTDGFAMRDRGNPSLARLAAFCEEMFDEWGYKKAILKRFHSLVFEGMVMHVLRRAALEADEKEKSKRIERGDMSMRITGPLQPSVIEAVGTPASLVKRYLDAAQEERVAQAFVKRTKTDIPAVPKGDPHPLIVKITMTRQSDQTDGILEYRVVFDPIQLVDFASSGIQGKHPDPSEQPDGSQPPAPSQRGKPPVNPTDKKPMWVSATIMRHVHPQVIADYEAGKTKAPRSKSNAKGKQRAAPNEEDEDDEDEDEDDDVEIITAPAKPKEKHSEEVKGTAHGVEAKQAGPSKRSADTTSVQPSPAKRRALAAVQPAPAANATAASQAKRQPDITPAQQAPREVKVKQEPVQPKPHIPSTVPPPKPANPPIASGSRLSQAAPQPPPTPAARRRQYRPPIPYTPPPPRTFFNVGLIETEESLSDNAFVFTFTDPDDPAYLVMDPKERYEQACAEAEAEVEVEAEAVESQRTQTQDHPVRTATSQPQPPTMPVKQEPSVQLLPLPPVAQGQTRRPPEPPVIVPPAVPPASNLPQVSARRDRPAQPPTPPAEDVEVEQMDEDISNTSGMNRYSEMFDQILGIRPGAKKRKAMSAAARKRAMAAMGPGPAEASGSQPPKKRRTNNTATAGPSSVLQPSTSAPVQSPHVPAPRAPLATRAGAAPFSASQPSPQAASPFLGIAPLNMTASQPARSTPPSRTVTRLDEIVIVSSDEEDEPSRGPAPAGRPASRPGVSRASTSQTTASGRKDFFADADRVIIL